MLLTANSAKRGVKAKQNATAEYAVALSRGDWI
jgi:hypothetical protein